MDHRDEAPERNPAAEGPLGRERGAASRAVHAEERRRQAEHEADGETDPALAQLHRDEAQIHARAARLQEQSAEIQRRYRREHGDM